MTEGGADRAPACPIRTAGAGPLTGNAPVLLPAAGPRAGDTVAEIYRDHYALLVRQAAVLVRDVATAEDVVQDSFAALYIAWWRLRDGDKVVSYLRRCVVNRSRSELRHRNVAERHAPEPPPDMPSAEEGALTLIERSAVMSALHTLAPRQREALVLRYYAGLPEGQIAAAMGISKGAVKQHTSRAMASLRAVLVPHMPAKPDLATPLTTCQQRSRTALGPARFRAGRALPRRGQLPHTVVMAFQAAQASGQGQIEFSFSANGGASWSAPAGRARRQRSPDGIHHSITVRP